VSAEPTTGPSTEYDIEAAHRALLDEGITACRGAFSRDWVARLREDVDAAFEEARGREGGAVGRGPQRWYVEVHPQAFRGFVDLVDLPWVRGICEAVLVQLHHCRHHRRDGPLRDRTRDTLGPRRGLRPWEVPDEAALSRVRVARGPQVPQGRRHLRSLGAHRAPRHRQPIVGGPPRRCPRRRRPRRRQPRAPRPGLHA
jgi:hypothetical protein